MSLRFTPRRPMLFVSAIGAGIACWPLALASPWPLPVICVTTLLLGAAMEIMMVQWTVGMARFIPPRMLARVSSYDALGSVMAMPVGALAVGPIAAAAGVSATEYGAAAVIVVVSLLALIPRQIRQIRWSDAPPAVPAEASEGSVSPAGAPAGSAAPVAALTGAPAGLPATAAARAGRTAVRSDAPARPDALVADQPGLVAARSGPR